MPPIALGSRRRRKPHAVLPKQRRGVSAEKAAANDQRLLIFHIRDYRSPFADSKGSVSSCSNDFINNPLAMIDITQ